MKVMVIVKATRASEAGEPSTAALRAAMDAFNDALRRAGVLIVADGLRTSAHGVRVQLDHAEPVVTRGPFAPPDQLIAGYWLWQVASLDEAIGWARQCPTPHVDGGVLEIRPVYEAHEAAELLARERGVLDGTVSPADANRRP